ncbi:MAG TPA: SDR family NAD(P)-dependent oxidoreductase, partial [Pseudolabrys sp.]
MTVTDSYSLAGKSAVVTGAGNGIGRAISLAFAEAGAAVACVDLDAKAAEATAAAIANKGRSLPVHCDVASETEVELAVKR